MAIPVDLTTIDPKTVTPEQIRAGLWKAILDWGAANVGSGCNRDIGYYSPDGMKCLCAFSKPRGDGMWDYWHVTATFDGRRHRTSERLKITFTRTYNASEWFWDPIVAELEAERTSGRRKTVVINHHCYAIAPDSSQPGSGDGFGGRRHDIEWLDDDGQPTGEVTVTRNLWARGIVPPTYRDRLRDNARWSPKAPQPPVDTE
jgi:hypothetical protein